MGYWWDRGPDKGTHHHDKMHIFHNIPFFHYITEDKGFVYVEQDHEKYVLINQIEAVYKLIMTLVFIIYYVCSY